MFSTTEATETFFAITKLFQSKDVSKWSCQPGLICQHLFTNIGNTQEIGVPRDQGDVVDGGGCDHCH